MTAPALSISTPHGRHYVRPGGSKPLPSVTNIIGMKDKPGLPRWAAKMVAEFTADNLDTVSKIRDRAAVIDLLKGAPWRSSRNAADRGDAVHTWVDRYVKGDAPTEEEVRAANRAEQGMWRQFLGITARYGIQYVQSEFTAWSDTHGYAGTADWMAKVGDVPLLLGDTKTGKNVYPEVGMQLAAIANADVLLEPDGTERPVPKFDRFAVLHVRPTFARLQPVTRIPECFKAFLALRQVFEWSSEVSDSVLEYSPKVESANV